MRRIPPCSKELFLQGKSDENQVSACVCASIRHTYQPSSITFEHTGEDWKCTVDEFGRWGWYRGVVVPVAAGEVTVLASASMFESAKDWDIYIGTNFGCYGPNGTRYSATRYVNDSFSLHGC